MYCSRSLLLSLISQTQALGRRPFFHQQKPPRRPFFKTLYLTTAKGQLGAGAAAGVPHQLLDENMLAGAASEAGIWTGNSARTTASTAAAPATNSPAGPRAVSSLSPMLVMNAGRVGSTYIPAHTAVCTTYG